MSFRSAIAFAAASALFTLLGVASVDCRLPTAKEANEALSVIQTACVIAHQALPETEVATACGVTEPFFGPLRNILASAREASAKAVSVAHPYRCP